jgi:hypothetical protein
VKKPLGKGGKIGKRMIFCAWRVAAEDRLRRLEEWCHARVFSPPRRCAGIPGFDL